MGSGRLHRGDHLENGVDIGRADTQRGHLLAHVVLRQCAIDDCHVMRAIAGFDGLQRADEPCVRHERRTDRRTAFAIAANGPRPSHQNAGSATTNDHMPILPIVPSASAAASRSQA